MSLTLQEFIGETDEQIESLLSSVERRSNILIDYVDDEVEQEKYLEELDRTGEVREEIEKVGERVEYGLRLLNGETDDSVNFDQDVDIEDDDLSDYRGKIAMMKGTYDGIVNRLKIAEQKVGNLDEEDRMGFEPAYLVDGERQQGRF